IAERAAARAGDPHPSLIQHAEGTRHEANLVDSGDVVPGCRWSYLIAEPGHFVLRSAHIPSGAPLPKGTVLTLVIDAATGRSTDGGLSNHYPDLDRLGPVTTDLRSPGTSRRAARAWCPKLAVLSAEQSPAGKIATSRWVWTINARYQHQIISDCPGVVSVGVSRAAVIRAEQQGKPLPGPHRLGESVIAVGVKARRYVPKSPVFLKGVPLLFQVVPGHGQLDIGTIPHLSSRGRKGRLSGVLSVCCNAHGSMPEAGIVAIKRHAVIFRLVRADHAGHFSVRLPIGVY